MRRWARCIAPFQEVEADQVRQNFVAIKAQVRAIVGREASPAQEVQDSAIAKTEPAEQPAQDSRDVALVEKAPTGQAPNTSHQEEENDVNRW